MDPAADNGCAVGHRHGAQPRTRWDERHLARLAAAQDGVVRAGELEALGLSRRARQSRLAQQRLIVLYRGIYAVGHGDLTERGRFRAAAWACGEGALLSHLAAARALGLWERPVPRADVTVILPRCPRVPGVGIHRTAAADATHARGIPCTSVSRLLADLAATPALEAVFERAERRGLIRPAEIERLVYNRPGADRLRALLATHRPKTGPTRSLLECRLLATLRRRGIREPIVNGHLELDGTLIEPDLMWPRERVLVELDGLDTHATPTAMRRDRRRDRLAIRHGWTPLRATWHDDLEAVAADIAATLRGE